MVKESDLERPEGRQIGPKVNTYDQETPEKNESAPHKGSTRTPESKPKFSHLTERRQAGGLATCSGTSHYQGKNCNTQLIIYLLLKLLNTLYYSKVD